MLKWNSRKERAIAKLAGTSFCIGFTIHIYNWPTMHPQFRSWSIVPFWHHISQWSNSVWTASWCKFLDESGFLIFSFVFSYLENTIFSKRLQKSMKSKIQHSISLLLFPFLVNISCMFIMWYDSTPAREISNFVLFWRQYP